MAGFNQDYLVLQTIDPGISGYAGLGAAVPSSWQIFNSAQTPDDVNVEDATYDAGGSGVNCFRQPQSATQSPSGYYQDAFITNGRSPHRASASIRGAEGVNSTTGPGGASILGLVYGTRFNGDATTSAPFIGLTIDTRFVATEEKIRLFINEVGFNQTITIPKPNQLPGDVWYRAGIEVLGRTVNFYLDPAFETDPTNLLGDSALELFFSYKLTNSRGMEGPPVFLGFHLGGAYNNTNWSGYTDAILEELQGPEQHANPGTGNTPGLLPTPNPSPGPGLLGWPKFPAFKTPALSTDFGYWRMKAIRQLTFTMNNLRIGP